MTAKKKDTKNIAALLEEESEAIDANRDAPVTESTVVTRGHGRSKTLQIRLNPDELEALERVAATRGLPTSTVAREAILRLIRPGEARVATREHLVDAITRYCDEALARADENFSQLRAALAQQQLQAVDQLMGKRVDLMFRPSGEHDPVVVSDFAKVAVLTQTLNRNVEELMQRFRQAEEFRKAEESTSELFK